MTTAFPLALDSFTKPQGSASGGSDKLNTAAVIHGQVHQNEIDAIQALEAKVGINSSAVTTSLDYQVKKGVHGITVTTTAGGTTTLTAASTPIQVFTGTSLQTVKTPDATTLIVGQPYLFINDSTAALSIRDTGNNVLVTLPGGGRAELKLSSAATANGVWRAIGHIPVAAFFGNAGLLSNGYVIAQATANGQTPLAARTNGGVNGFAVSNTSASDVLIDIGSSAVTSTVQFWNGGGSYITLQYAGPGLVLDGSLTVNDSLTIGAETQTYGLEVTNHVTDTDALGTKTYLPHVVDITNTTTNSSAGGLYTPVGSGFIASGEVNFKVAVPGILTQVGISHPLYSIVSADFFCSGSAVYSAVAMEVAQIKGDTSNSQAILEFYPLMSGTYTFRFKYHCRIDFLV